MDTLSQGDRATFENRAVSFNYVLNYKVDSWQHEIELSIMSNSDQITEDKNETQIIKEDLIQITQKHEEMSSTFIEEREVLKTIIDENKNMKTKLEELLSLVSIIIEDKKMKEENKKISEETGVLKSIIDDNKIKMDQMEIKMEDNAMENKKISEETKVLKSIIDDNNNKIDIKMEDHSQELLALKIAVIENKELIETNKKNEDEIKELKTIIDENLDKMAQMETTMRDKSEELLALKTLVIENKDLLETNKKMSEEISALKTFTNFTVYIYSTGGAAERQGDKLGQFEFNLEKRIYVQTSTEQSNEKFKPRYLYQDNNKKWWVNDEPGEKTGWLRSDPSRSLPTSWKYYADGKWNDDDTLSVTSGPLPPLSRQFTVTASGAAAEKWPSSQGVFTRTQRWWWGRPVYVNTEGKLLHHGAGDDGWLIGSKLGKYVLRGSRSHHSPVSETSWRYWTGSGTKPASVTVTGSD